MSYRTHMKVGEIEVGMPMVDYFAAKALPAVIEANPYDAPSKLATRAWEIASAMMRGRPSDG